ARASFSSTTRLRALEDSAKVALNSEAKTTHATAKIRTRSTVIRESLLDPATVHWDDEPSTGETAPRRCCRHLAGSALLRLVCRQDAGSTLGFIESKSYRLNWRAAAVRNRASFAVTSSSTSASAGFPKASCSHINSSFARGSLCLADQEAASESSRSAGTPEIFPPVPACWLRTTRACSCSHPFFDNVRSRSSLTVSWVRSRGFARGLPFAVTRQMR